MRWVLRAAIAPGILLGLSACMDGQSIPVAPAGQSSTPVTAPPSQAGSTAQQEAAPEQRPTAQEAGDPYLTLLRDRVAKYLPAHDEGSVKRSATYLVGLHRDGSLAFIQLLRSSGIDRIDQLGEATIRRASPMPPVPRDFPGDPVVRLTARLEISSS
jgi:hypothetical protein